MIPIFVIGITGFSYSYFEARNIRVVNYDFIHDDIPLSFTAIIILRLMM